MQQRLNVVPWSMSEVTNSVFVSLKVRVGLKTLRSYDVAPGKNTEVH